MSRRALLAALLAAGCGAPAAPEPAFWRPWYDPPAAAASDPPPPLGDGSGPSGPTAPGACTLDISATTVSLGGTYAPNNIGAIWIADGSGRFLRTLRLWADRRIEHLDRWNKVTLAAGAPGSVVDAVTSATLTAHGTRTARWSCDGAPDGPYAACFELTDANSAGPSDCVAFTKVHGAAAEMLTPPDLPDFHARKLVLSP